MFLSLLEFLLCSFVVIVFVSQIIIPLLCGSLLFPYFRSKLVPLGREKVRVEDSIKAKSLEEEISNLKGTK